MTRLIACNFALALCLVWCPTGAWAIDEIEPNDTAVEAQRLHLQADLNVDDLRGIFVSGHLNRPGEPDSGQDWYRFEARTGERVNIHYWNRGDTEVRVDLKLYDDNGDELLDPRPASIRGSGASVRIADYPIERDGAYIIEVRYREGISSPNASATYGLVVSVGAHVYFEEERTGSNSYAPKQVGEPCTYLSDEGVIDGSCTYQGADMVCRSAGGTGQALDARAACEGRGEPLRLSSMSPRPTFRVVGNLSEVDTTDWYLLYGHTGERLSVRVSALHHGADDIGPFEPALTLRGPALAEPLSFEIDAERGNAEGTLQVDANGILFLGVTTNQGRGFYHLSVEVENSRFTYEREPPDESVDDDRETRDQNATRLIQYVDSKVEGLTWSFGQGELGLSPQDETNEYDWYAFRATMGQRAMVTAHTVWEPGNQANPVVRANAENLGVLDMDVYNGNLTRAQEVGTENATAWSARAPNNQVRAFDLNIPCPAGLNPSRECPEQSGNFYFRLRNQLFEQVGIYEIEVLTIDNGRTERETSFGDTPIQFQRNDIRPSAVFLQENAKERLLGVLDTDDVDQFDMGFLQAGQQAYLRVDIPDLSVLAPSLKIQVDGDDITQFDADAIENGILFTAPRSGRYLMALTAESGDGWNAYYVITYDRASFYPDGFVMHDEDAPFRYNAMGFSLHDGRANPSALGVGLMDADDSTDTFEVILQGKDRAYVVVDVLHGDLEVTAEVLGAGDNGHGRPLFGHDAVVSGVVNTSRHAETIQVSVRRTAGDGAYGVEVFRGPDGLFKYENRLFGLTYGQDVSKRCAFRRLDLATIDSLALDEWTQMAFGGGQGYWVGLVQDGESGDYAWESGAPVTYDRLDSEHPQAPFGIIDGTGRWSTAEADVRLGALFELAEKSVALLSPIRTGEIAVGDALYLSADIEGLGQWTFSDGRMIEGSRLGLVPFRERGTLSIEINSGPRLLSAAGAEGVECIAEGSACLASADCCSPQRCVERVCIASNRSIDIDDCSDFVLEPSDLGQGVAAGLAFDIEVASNPGTLPDLVVRNMQLSGPAYAGMPTRLNYQISNEGEGRFDVNWTDAIYLSDDEHLDAQDQKVTAVQRFAYDDDWQFLGLEIGAVQDYSIDFTLPLEVFESRFLILAVDDLWEKLEVHQLNNERALPLNAGYAALTEDDISGRLLQSGDVRVYAGEVGTTGVFHATAASEGGCMRAVLSSGRACDPNGPGARATTVCDGSATIAVHRPTPGTWYLCLQALDDEVNYGVRGRAFELRIEDVSPNLHGATEDVEILIRGTGFIGVDALELVDPEGNPVLSFELDVLDDRRILGRFDLSDTVPGMYDLVLNRGDESIRMEGAMEVTSSAGPRFVSDLIMPGRMGQRSPSIIWVEYGNDGDEAMPAPLLILSANRGSRMTLDSEHMARGVWSRNAPDGFSDRVQFLASGLRAGVIQPGERVRVPVYFAGLTDPENAGQTQVTIDAQIKIIHAHNNEEIDWETYFNDRHWGHTPDVLKPAREQALRGILGETWGAYVQYLIQAAQFLDRFAVHTRDVQSLLTFAERTVSGVQPKLLLTGSKDISLPATGIPMEIERTYEYSGPCFGEPAIERCPPSVPAEHPPWHGDFGFGWTFNWGISLTEAPDTGVVKVLFGAGRVLRFDPDRRDPLARRYISASGSGRLVKQANGTFEYINLQNAIYTFEAPALGSGRPGYRLAQIRAASGEDVSLRYTNGDLVAVEHSTGPCFVFERQRLSGRTGSRIATVHGHESRCIDAQACASDPELCGIKLDYRYHGQHEHLSAVGFDGGIGFAYQYEDNVPGDHFPQLTQTMFGQRTLHAFTYDDHGRLVERRFDGGRIGQRLEYGDWGQVTYRGDDGSYVTHHHGLGRQVLAITDVAGEVWQRSYDQRGRLSRLIPPDGYGINFDYNADDQVTRMVDRLGGIYDFAYHQGRLARVDTPEGLLLEVRSASNDEKRWVFPDGSSILESFDDDTASLALIGRDGSTRTIRKDEQGRIAEVLINGQTWNTVHYDGAGRPHGIEGPNERIQLTFGNMTGRLIRIESQDPNTFESRHTLSMGHDLDERIRVRLRDQHGRDTNFGYDGLALQTIANNEGEIARYEFAPGDRVQSVTLGNGVVTEFNFDDAGRIVAILNRGPNGETLSHFDYEYDKLGKIRRAESHLGIWEYTYDLDGRLVDANLAPTLDDMPPKRYTFEYDGDGNRLSQNRDGNEFGYQSNSLDQYTRAGNAQVSYDDAGRLSFFARGLEELHFEYALNGSLSAVHGSHPLTLEYGVAGDLQTVSNGEDIHRFVQDPFNFRQVVLHQMNDQPARRCHHLDLLRACEVNGHEQADSAPRMLYYTYDLLGHVSEVTDETGRVLNRYGYGPFGDLFHRDETVENPFTFLGGHGWRDHGNGLYFVQSRHYLAALGRFLQPDPSLVGGGTHFYAYAFNDPINLIDRNGRSPLGDFALGVATGVGTNAAAGGETNSGSLAMAAVTAMFSGPTGSAVSTLLNADLAKGVYAGAPHVLNPTKRIEDRTRRFFQPGGGGPFTKCRAFDGCPEGSPDDPDGGGNGQGNDNGSGIGDGGPDGSCCGSNGPSGSSPAGPAVDPNEKHSADGPGPERYVRGDQRLFYEIHFENDAEAEVPAQQVDIVDPLMASLDLSTLEIHSIAFGDVYLALPLKVQSFEERLPMTQDGMDFEVEIRVELDAERRTLVAQFLAVDPVWGLPPPAGIGFLPPEDGTGRGQGSITFSVAPQPGLPSGTEFRNVAEITFDFIETIATNQIDPHDPSLGTDPSKEALNTIDAQPPRSTLIAPDDSETETFEVSWFGEDSHSGIAHFDIYKREGEGPWRLWHQKTTERSAIFQGEYGRQYAFYSLAEDRVGNREDGPMTIVTTAVNAMELSVGDDVAGIPEGDDHPMAGHTGSSGGAQSHTEDSDPDSTNAVENTVAGSDYESSLTGESDGAGTDMTDAESQPSSDPVGAFDNDIGPHETVPIAGMVHSLSEGHNGGAPNEPGDSLNEAAAAGCGCTTSARGPAEPTFLILMFVLALSCPRRHRRRR